LTTLEVLVSFKLLLLFLHLLCVAVWLGCILVEAIFEHSIEPGPSMRCFVARLHWTTDKYIEIPAFAGVLLTGIGLASKSNFNLLLEIKVGFGLLAVLANLVCVALVVKRLRAAQAKDFAHYEVLDHLQHKVGAVVLLGVVVALSIGGYLFATGRY
jgi:putative copper export protein